MLALLLTSAALATPPTVSALLHTLRAEAEAIVEGTRPLQRRPDLPQRTPESPDPRALARVLAQPAHGDAFVDAYARWQLSAYPDAHLPEETFDDPRRLARLLQRLPALPANPEADDALLRDLGRLAGAGALSEPDRAELDRRLDDLAASASRAKAMTIPALGVRSWLERDADRRAAAGALVRLERLGALVTAGWPCEREKEELERFLAERAGAFDGDDRAMLARAATRLVGPERLFVRDVRIEEGSVTVSYGAAAVDDFTVRRWIRILEPIDP